jgi:hypothetical protein
MMAFNRSGYTRKFRQSPPKPLFRLDSRPRFSVSYIITVAERALSRRPGLPHFGVGDYAALPARSLNVQGFDIPSTDQCLWRAYGW